MAHPINPIHQLIPSTVGVERDWLEMFQILLNTNVCLLFMTSAWGAVLVRI
jgi:hypothetical protein